MNDNGNRLLSLDAYRGFVMLAMVSSGLGMGVSPGDVMAAQCAAPSLAQFS